MCTIYYLVPNEYKLFKKIFNKISLNNELNDGQVFFKLLKEMLSEYTFIN